MEYYYQTLLYNLFLNDFEPLDRIHTEREVPFPDNLCLYKLSGSMFLAVNIITNTDYKTIDSQTKLKLEKIMEANNFKEIFYLSIYLREDITPDLVDYCNVDFCKDRLTHIPWIVDIKNKKIIINKKQPDKILNVKQIVETSFTSKHPNLFSVYNIYEFARIGKYTAQKSKDTKLTNFLIFVNIIIFAAMELSGGSTNTDVLIDFGALVPELILNRGEYYRIFTCMFLHIGYIHLLSNMLSLYIFGTRLEEAFGKPYMTVTYFLSGISSSLFSLFLSGNISAGASGAIFGLLGSLVVFAFTKKKSFEGFDLQLLIILAGINILTGYYIPNVDNAGHIGGFICGVVLSLISSIFIKV